MGLLTASQEMKRFAEIVLQLFTSTNVFEYQDAQGVLKRTFGTAACYIDDTCDPAKCEFLLHEAAFLGHVLRKDGILTQDSKISAIKNWPPLTDIRSVRVFVSLCSYYHKYIWRFAEISAPLTDLLKDGQ
jgi:hypothetical protein